MKVQKRYETRAGERRQSRGDGESDTGRGLKFESQGGGCEGEPEKKEKGGYGSRSSVVETADGQWKMISAGDHWVGMGVKGAACLRWPPVSSSVSL